MKRILHKLRLGTVVGTLLLPPGAACARKPPVTAAAPAQPALPERVLTRADAAVIL